jgi:hypothetical protein
MSLIPHNHFYIIINSIIELFLNKLQDFIIDFNIFQHILQNISLKLINIIYQYKAQIKDQLREPINKAFD